MLKLIQRAREKQLGVPSLTATDYINTIPPGASPGSPATRRWSAACWLRWNAAVMVHRAQRPDISVGHISTYASAATLYGVLQPLLARQGPPGRWRPDLLPGHASPGMYARAFLEGRLTEAQLDGFRQEEPHRRRQALALPSYPHPRMPDFWEFPTVSMGLGPINAIYQAQFNKYLQNRGIKDTSQHASGRSSATARWTSPSRAACCSLAAGEGSTTSFVINCNLQRLDGPVRGNGKIIQELESFFRGAGWNVIKVVWGRGWDPLLAQDGTARSSTS